jgi:hypothetical protein
LKTTRLAIALALATPLGWGVLYSPAIGADAEVKKSLNDARQGVIKGTSPGIEIIPARTRAPASANAASAAAVGGSAASSASSSMAGASAPKMAGVAPAADKPFSALREAAANILHEPVSGESMGSAKRLTSPSLGIALPTRAEVPKRAASSPVPASR